MDAPMPVSAEIVAGAILGFAVLGGGAWLWLNIVTHMD